MVGAGWQAIELAGSGEDPDRALRLAADRVRGWLCICSRLILALSWNATPRINACFKRGQMLTGLALALSHGTNDSQKTMGIITLALVTDGFLDSLRRSRSGSSSLCASMIALGTAVGGWRLIRTLGGKIFKIRPVDGFTSQLASASVILAASLVGGPVSTTQVVSSSIMGTGAAERANKVRWGVAQEMAIAWLLTIPASALMAAGLYFLIVSSRSVNEFRSARVTTHPTGPGMSIGNAAPGSLLKPGRAHHMTSRKKVILVLSDGLRYDTAVESMGYLGHLVEARRASLYKVQGEMPSISRPMYETIHTGLPVSEHGIVSNLVVRRSSKPNIFSAAVDAGRTTAAAAYGWFSELYNRAPFDRIQDREVDDPSLLIQHGRFYIEDDYPDAELFASAAMLDSPLLPGLRPRAPYGCG